MRQKKLKFVTEELLQSKGVIVDIQKADLPINQKIHLEVGSGKGQFIISLARDHQDEFFIAFELNMSVIYRIVEKKEALQLNNLLIILGDANHLLDYFEPNTIDHIYLSFSDPWPKAKHHKRRLTAPSFLEKYDVILKDDGLFQFRTDVLPFFLDSIETVEQAFDIFEITYDLPISNYMTEYEEKKRDISKINQLKGRKKHA